MAVIPPPQKPTLIELIDQSHEARAERPRPHMGASQLGHHCDRWLWLNFRWAVQERLKGRTLRLFRRGQNEEATVVSDLRAAGLHITDTGGNQSRVDFSNHVSGSIDGIIHTGVPESPNKPHILEIKTHNDKSFKEVCAKGVKESKPVHYAQMQVYMLGKNIDRALYIAVNKNDDCLYAERVRLDKKEAQELVERGHRLVSVDRMPEPVSADPSWYLCRFCAAHNFCHESHQVKEVNCRTCAHSTAEPDGTWICVRWGNAIPAEFQYTGCESHVFHPDLVPWQLSPDSTEHVAVWLINGVKVKNGDLDQGGYTSLEIMADIESVKANDPNIAMLREKFDGRLVK